jgi:hypothetical protein
MKLKSPTPETDAEAERILDEFGPNNNVRFAAMCDFVRTLEIQRNELQKKYDQLVIDHRAQCEWTTAQRAFFESL